MRAEDLTKGLSLSNPPTSEVQGDDPMIRARSRWVKGRHESMGGPTFFVQDGLNNNNRTCGNPPGLTYRDPVADELGVDFQE